MIFIKVVALVTIFVAIWFTVRFFIKAYDKASGVVDQISGSPGG
ncbi:MAG: hypothetical protein ABIP20_21425 [Chthoniobacteraceae bacterium]